MGKGKLKKFAQLAGYANVYQNFSFEEPNLVDHLNQSVDLKGKWKAEHFKNDQPLVVELACGRGEYSNTLAAMYPEKNFIGIDIKGARIWKGARDALEAGLENVVYLRTRIELLNHFFDKGEIDEIWITFPDPFPKKGQKNRRLTSPIFLNLYRKLCRPNAVVHLKTDNVQLFDYTLEVLESEGLKAATVMRDIYSGSLDDPILKVKTYYELQHIANGLTINYLNFQLA